MRAFSSRKKKSRLSSTKTAVPAPVADQRERTRPQLRSSARADRDRAPRRGIPRAPSDGDAGSSTAPAERGYPACQPFHPILTRVARGIVTQISGVAVERPAASRGVRGFRFIELVGRPHDFQFPRRLPLGGGLDDERGSRSRPVSLSAASAPCALRRLLLQRVCRRQHAARRAADPRQAGGLLSTASANSALSARKLQKPMNGGRPCFLRAATDVLIRVEVRRNLDRLVCGARMQ